jgi:hypothetical protein
VGISRSSGGDIKVRGRGLEVKVKKKVVGGACPLQLPLLTRGLSTSVRRQNGNRCGKSSGSSTAPKAGSAGR